MVEGTGLENQRALTGTVGSNPTPSAILCYSAVCGVMKDVGIDENPAQRKLWVRLQGALADARIEKATQEVA